METDQTNITYDLGILTMFDSKPLTYKYDANDSIFPEKLQEQSLQNIKKIVHALHALKVKKDQAFEAIPDEHQVIDFGQSQFDVTLPEVTTIFPRHKKLPEQAALTKWERFAKDKGIEKKKRSRMVYDEITKTFVPRWGARSIKKIQNEVDIIREVKPGENPNEDPFEKKSQVKRLQKEKQKYNELRNKMEAKGMLKKGDVPDTITNTHNKKHKDAKAANRTLQIGKKNK